MAQFQFELVSPERLLVSEEVDEVQVPGTEGDFTVLPGHAPVMSTIRPGILTVIAGSDRTDYVIYGGFVEVGPAGLTVLAERTIEKSSIDREELAAKIRNAREDVADAKDADAKAKAEEELQSLTQLERML